MTLDPTRLYTLLLNTSLQTRDNKLYQVIHNLIGALTIVANQTSTIITGSAGSTGATGPQGIIGLSGEDGIDGVDGISGVAGIQGIQGTQGIPGVDGVDGIDDTLFRLPSIQDLISSFPRVPVIYGFGRSAGAVAAVTSVVAYTVGAVDGSFYVSANVLITVSVTHSFTVTCTYTDESNTSRVLTLNFSQVTGAFVTSITNILGAGAYEGVPMHIRCKALTAITIATAGVFTSVTYNVEGSITQFA